MWSGGSAWVVCDSRVQTSRVESGDQAGEPMSASSSSTSTRVSPLAVSVTTSRLRHEARASGTSSDRASHRPSGGERDVGAGAVGRDRAGVRSRQAGSAPSAVTCPTKNARGTAGPRSWSQNRTG